MSLIHRDTMMTAVRFGLVKHLYNKDLRNVLLGIVFSGDNNLSKDIDVEGNIKCFNACFDEVTEKVATWLREEQLWKK